MAIFIHLIFFNVIMVLSNDGSGVQNPTGQFNNVLQKSTTLVLGKTKEKTKLLFNCAIYGVQLWLVR